MYKLTRAWNDMRASFWCMPFIILALAIALAFSLTYLDESGVEQWLEHYPRLFGTSAAGAREMLSTIAGSMISVVGIVFSMTLVALALVSSQYSPRVLSTFMRSRVTQAAIGIFTGIFVYCLIVLRGVRGEDESTFVPVAAVSVAMVLAVVGVAVLIVFIHHIAQSIQASTILANIAQETILTVESVFPAMSDTSTDDNRLSDEAAAVLVQQARWLAVLAPKSGYVQSIDEDALLRFACKGRVMVRVEYGVGHFVIAGTPMFSVSVALEGGNGSTSDLNRMIAVSDHRTIEQDPGFGLRQLVDVALKALSPGVNDTSTAIMCLDNLGAVLGVIARRKIPSPYRFAAGELKVVSVTPDFAGLLAEAFDQIRRSAGGNVAIILRMIGTIEMLGSLATEKEEILLAHLDLLDELSARTIPAPHDAALVSERLVAVRKEIAARC